MAAGLYTPLQIIAAQGMLANTGITVANNLANAAADYNSIPAIASLLATLDLASTYGLSNATITQIKTIGSTNCPPLGASIPSAYANTITPVQTAATIPATVDGGFAQFVVDTADKYLGNGSDANFVSVYTSVVSYQSQVTQLIYSTVNANKLTKEFTTMNDLITGNVTRVTLAIPAFAADLARIGQAISLARLDQLGTPAGLLQQISLAANIVQGTLPAIDTALRAQGLDEAEIIRLCTPEQSTLNLTRNEFNTLQSRAYQALGTITGTDLQDILNILDVTIQGLTSLQDLLNPVRLFTNSWPSLTVPTDNGPELIYEPSGSVNFNITQFLNSIEFGPNNTATGCDELSKIVPTEQAVASVALAVSLSQIANIADLTPAQLAQALA